MTTQPRAPDSPCPMLGRGGRAAAAQRHRTDRHGIAALGHGIAAVLIKFDRTRPGAPPGAGGSTP